MSAYQIRTAFSFDVAKSKKRCLMKLLMDHFTYIGLLSRFNIDWTTTIQSLLSINDIYLTVVPAEMFNFDCFISQHVESRRKFSLNSILVSLSPLFYGIISLAMFYLGKFAIKLGKTLKDHWKRRKRGKLSETQRAGPGFINVEKEQERGFSQNSFAAALIIFYNFYPRLLINGLSWLRCIAIDDIGTMVLENDPDTLCWTGDHTKYVWGISFPTMIGWNISVPLLLFYLTFKMKTAAKLGKSASGWQHLIEFITIDYQDRYYYWDLFSYASKFAVVFCAMATNGLEPASQGALLILMMLFVFLAHEKVRPYKYGFVNDMFTFSYIVTICTAAFAIIVSTKGLAEDRRFIYLLLLIGINLIFYIAWVFYFIRETLKLKVIEYLQRVKKLIKDAQLKSHRVA